MYVTSLQPWNPSYIGVFHHECAFLYIVVGFEPSSLTEASGKLECVYHIARTHQHLVTSDLCAKEESLPILFNGPTALGERRQEIGRREGFIVLHLYTHKNQITISGTSQ